MIAAVDARWRHLLHELESRRERLRAHEVQAICPVDSWAFRPRYTEGHCPLCGWEPPGAVVQLPLTRRLDSFSWMVLAVLLVSVVMAVVVGIMYARA